MLLIESILKWERLSMDVARCSEDYPRSPITTSPPTFNTISRNPTLSRSMECTRCTRRLISRRLGPSISSRRPFSISPTHQRLGAFNYAQEWQTGSYHFNKATTKTYPVAAQRTDELLQNWFTQRSKRQAGPTDASGRPESSSDSAYAQQIRRNAITTQRRMSDRILVSNSTAKDFGEKVEVTAFVYDGIEAAERARQKRNLAKRGAKDQSGESAPKKRVPVRRGRGPPGGGGMRSAFAPGRSGPGSGSGSGPGVKIFSFGTRTGGAGGVRRPPGILSRLGNAGVGRAGGNTGFRGPRSGGPAGSPFGPPKPAARQ